MTMTAPDIAVLMPVYNPAAELVMTLDSIRRQTVPCRLYLVDDGSKTKPDYHALLKGIDYRLIELPQNAGITGALNAGLLLRAPVPARGRRGDGGLAPPDR